MSYNVLRVKHFGTPCTQIPPLHKRVCEPAYTQVLKFYYSVITRKKIATCMVGEKDQILSVFQIHFFYLQAHHFESVIKMIVYQYKIFMKN